MPFTSFTVTLSGNTIIGTPNPLFTRLQSATGIIADGPKFTLHSQTSVTDPTIFFGAMRQHFPTNASHPDYSNLTVLGVRELQVSTPTNQYLYQVDYVQTDSGGVPFEVTSVSDLVAQPPRVERVNYDYYQVPAYVDSFGNPKINSSGDAFDPPNPIEHARVVATLSWWEIGYAGEEWVNFINHLNNAPAVVPGYGLCATRTARIVSIAPAAGFNPYLTAIATTSGTASHDDFITWGTGKNGYFGAIVGTGGAFTVINPTAGVSVGDSFSGTASGFTATATSATWLPPAKIFCTVEIRPDGFDIPDIDQGSRAWWNDGTHTTLQQITQNGVRTGADVLLRGGAPSTYAANSSDQTYGAASVNGTAGHWSTATSNDYLLARVTLGQVNRTSNGLIDLITFKDIPDVDFSGLF